MGLAGDFLRSVILVTWPCAALHALSDHFGQTPSEPVDYLHDWSLYGAEDIAYTDEDTFFLAGLSASRTRDSWTSGNGTELELPYMWGRLGDALNQLLATILWAEKSNATALHVSDRGFRKVEGFLDIPKDSKGRRVITINPKSRVVVDPGGDCKMVKVGSDGSMVSCPADARTRRRVMIKYVKPLLVPLARADVRSHGSDADELVIHVRSGDAWRKEKTPWGTPLVEYRMPPCAFYDKIIETGNKGGAFQHVRVVTQADRENPCVDLIRKRHPTRSVRVQTMSREEDAAAIMNARHLVTSQSYFSWILAEMNERLETLFITDCVPGFLQGVVPCGSQGDPKVVKVTIPGLEVVRSPPAKKKEWSIDYSQENLSLAVC